MGANLLLGAAVALMMNQAAGGPAGCEGAQAELAALEVERAEIRRTLSDIAMGKAPKKKRKLSGGDVARGAAGAAASILLPFPLGLAVNAGAAAAAKGRQDKGRAAEGPDARKMIEREREIGVRLIALRACG